VTAMDDLPDAPPGDAGQRLAAGFAEHVVGWAQRLGCDQAHLPLLRRAACEASAASGSGHVCVLLSQLAAGEDEAFLRGSLLATGVVGTAASPGASPLILDEDGRLYLHRFFDEEARLARRILQAAGERPRTVSDAARELLGTLFPPGVQDEVDWQKIAAAMALRNTLTVVSGGPGTGKTTTVVNLLACLLAQEPEARIALAAPTGKAAARMVEAIRQRAGHLPPDLRSKLPQEAFTIHRLLGANPAQRRFAHDAANPIPYDALIVDEASMLDLALATRLLEAVPPSARIVLLGDKDQLAAVEAGAVFAELSAAPTLTEDCRRDLAALCGETPDRIAPSAPAQASPLRDVAVWLTRNYRFPADSAIGQLARHVNEGRAQQAMALPPFDPSGPKVMAATVPTVPGRQRKAAPDGGTAPLFPELAAPGRDASVRWLDPGQGQDMLEAILAGYADYFATVRCDPADVSAILRAFDGFRVLCAVREGEGGSSWVNEQVTRHARQELSALAAFRQPGSPWYAGRPVMVLRNDYVLKLFNGDIGIALPAGGELAVMFPEGEQGLRAVPIARMPQHETAFATTVHKAQGSEFEAVVLVLPRQPSRIAVRELLYTAVTRARSRVVLAACAETLAAAIAATSQRHSGLLARLAHGTQPRYP